jgi:hypothetical protein
MLRCWKGMKRKLQNRVSFPAHVLKVKAWKLILFSSGLSCVRGFPVPTHILAYAMIVSLTSISAIQRWNALPFIRSTIFAIFNCSVALQGAV